jgi:hypothetical protein
MECTREQNKEISLAYFCVPVVIIKRKLLSKLPYPKISILGSNKSLIALLSLFNIKNSISYMEQNIKQLR